MLYENPALGRILMRIPVSTRLDLVGSVSHQLPYRSEAVSSNTKAQCGTDRGQGLA